MTRLIAVVTALALPGTAQAWDAGRDGAICTLAHREDGTDIVLTFDPAGPLYTITATQTEPWPQAPVFGIIFQGGAAQTITTDRHRLSDDRQSLSVADTGFGNVLRGLSDNTTATLFTGDAAVTVSLTGAAPEVAEFAACQTMPTA
jgi:hypothetical protein